MNTKVVLEVITLLELLERLRLLYQNIYTRKIIVFSNSKIVIRNVIMTK